MAKASGGTRRSTPRQTQPTITVAPPRFAVGRVAPRTAEERRNRPLRPSVERNSTSATERTDTSYRMFPRAIRNVERLDKIKDPAVYRDVRRAISRFHSVLGVRETNFILADVMDRNEVAADYHSRSGSDFIVLNKRFFNVPHKQFVKRVKDMYNRHWSTRTNKPVAHTVTHELAHAMWVTEFSSDRHQAAGREIRSLRRKWLRDPDIVKLGYGDYARSSVSEWWAEVVTKAVHGESDKYTKGVVEIIKKHKL